MERKLLRHMEFYPVKTVCNEKAGTLNIHAAGQLLPAGKYVGFLVEWNWTVTPDGPEPEEKYELCPYDFRFAFLFAPSSDTDYLRQL